MSSLDRDNLEHILNIFGNFPFQLFLVLHHIEELPKETIQVINLDERNKNEDKN
jgi:ABC-type molybdenum transport system ATPase subunit/photorepair protein PhrA